MFRMRNERLKGGSLHDHVFNAGTARPKYSQRPSPVSQTSGAGIVDTFLANICKSEWSGLDDVQSELFTAILEVVFVPNELRRRGDKATNANPAERQVSDVDARTATAVIYHVQREGLSRKLLTERGEPRALRQHLGRPSQKARQRRHLGLPFFGAPRGIVSSELRCMCEMDYRSGR
jgi:hypothetical protein